MLDTVFHFVIDMLQPDCFLKSVCFLPSPFFFIQQQFQSCFIADDSLIFLADAGPSWNGLGQFELLPVARFE